MTLLALALALARKIAPVDGKIVLLSIGMSNTTQEFQAFQKLAAADPDLNPRLLIVDGAQGGQTAAITAQPQSKFWTEVDRRLTAAGASAAQVQVVWLKQANARPVEPFPTEAKKLQADLLSTLQTLVSEVTGGAGAFACQISNRELCRPRSPAAAPAHTAGRCRRTLR